MNQPPRNRSSVWFREGWRRVGPGQLCCPHCHKRVSSNALARASHARACKAGPELPK